MSPPRMMLILAHTIEATKLAFIFTLALITTAMAEVTETAANYPLLTSGIIGLMAAVAVKYIEKWLDGRNKTIKTADKVLELEHADKKELREQHAKLMADKEAWWKLQNDRLQAEKQDIEQRARIYRREARETNQAAVNEMVRLHNVILTLHRTMVLHNIAVPEQADTDLRQFMLPAWESDEDEHTTVD